MTFETKYPSHGDTMLALSAVPTIRNATAAEKAKVGHVLAGAAAKWKFGEPGEERQPMFGAAGDDDEPLPCDCDSQAADLSNQARSLIAEDAAMFGASGQEGGNPERRKAILRTLGALAKYLLPLLLV